MADIDQWSTPAMPLFRIFVFAASLIRTKPALETSATGLSLESGDTFFWCSFRGNDLDRTAGFRNLFLGGFTRTGNNKLKDFGQFSIAQNLDLVAYNLDQPLLS